MLSIASRLVWSAPTTSSRRMFESDARSSVCGDLPAVRNGMKMTVPRMTIMPEGDDDLRVAHQPARHAEPDRVVVHESPQQVGEDGTEHDQQLAQSLLAGAFPVGVGVDVLAAQHLAGAQSCHFHAVPLFCCDAAVTPLRGCDRRLRVAHRT